MFKRFISTFLITVLVFTTVMVPAETLYAESVVNVDISVVYGQTEARSMLQRINDFRTGDMAWAWNETNTEKVRYEGLNTLTYDYELERVAMLRAAEIAVSYSHTRPNGEMCFTAYPSDYEYGYCGENIAYGYTSEESVYLAWREDDDKYDGQGHRRNMLEEHFTSIGIGHCKYNGRDYWVQEFAGTVADGNDSGANDSKTTVTIEALESIASKLKVEESVDTGDQGSDDSEHTSGKFTYKFLNNGEIVITGCKVKGDISIPESLDGYKVTQLDKKLFYGQNDIISVRIPSTVNSMDDFDYVFSYCYDLKKIIVDEGNPAFTSVSGVLYSKDMSKLYCYPCGRTGEVYHVPKGVSKLLCTSFASAKNLKKLYLDDADTTWYTYTFYNDSDLKVVYIPGGKTETKVKDGKDYGPQFITLAESEKEEEAQKQAEEVIVPGGSEETEKPQETEKPDETGETTVVTTEKAESRASLAVKQKKIARGKSYTIKVKDTNDQSVVFELSPKAKKAGIKVGKTSGKIKVPKKIKKGKYTINVIVKESRGYNAKRLTFTVIVKG